MPLYAFYCAVFIRDLDKQEAEIKEKLKQEKKREERKNREAFSDLLREDMDEGFIKPKMRWRVCPRLARSQHSFSCFYQARCHLVMSCLPQHEFKSNTDLCLVSLTAQSLCYVVLHVFMTAVAGRQADRYAGCTFVYDHNT